MTDPLTQIFSALANQTRREILSRLAEGAATVNELAEPFDMSLPAISRHLKVLEKAGLISRGQNAQFRPCVLEPEPFQAISEWTETYRAIWETSFERMDNYIEQLNKEET